MNSRRRQLGIRLAVFLVSRPGTDSALQHHDEEHSMIECPECDREFETQRAVDQVRGQPPLDVHLPDRYLHSTAGQNIASNVPSVTANLATSTR